MAELFADRLVQRARQLGHPLCLGMDPHLERIPPLFRKGPLQRGDPHAAEAVEHFCRALLDRAVGRVVAVKPQSAFFEALGWPGVRCLSRVLAAARERELPVILDAKRGDVGSTAAAYAAAYLEEGAPLRADALTVNPYLGLEGLEPFLAAARVSGAGLFVLARTSNPGAGELQEGTGEGPPLYARVAQALAPRAGALEGPLSGWSGLGVVVAATCPEAARRIREILPRSLFLVPGYGAQGASAAQALAGFVPAAGGPREGGVVSSSRALLFPPGSDTDAAGVWERAVDTALERAAAELGQALAGRSSL